MHGGIASGGVRFSAAGAAGGRAPQAGLDPAARRRGSQDRAGRAGPGPHPAAGDRADRHLSYANGFACTLHLRLRDIVPGEQSRFGMFGMFGDQVYPAGEYRRGRSTPP
jgi:hypothetical protein